MYEDCIKDPNCPPFPLPSFSSQSIFRIVGWQIDTHYRALAGLGWLEYEGGHQKAHFSNWEIRTRGPVGGGYFI